MHSKIVTKYHHIKVASNVKLTGACGSHMVLANASAALVVDLIVSVRPYLNHRVAPLSYVAVGC